MTIRLNSTIREGIVKNALAKAGITKELAELAQARRQWTEEVRVYVNGATDEEILAVEAEALEVLRKLPKGLIERPRILRESRMIYLNLGGLNVKGEFRDAAGSLQWAIVPAEGRSVVPAGHELEKRFHALEERAKTLEDREQTLRKQVGEAVGAVTTVKRLLEVWPEAVELIPETTRRAAANLPAIPFQDLNKTIGLPS